MAIGVGWIVATGAGAGGGGLLEQPHRKRPIIPADNSPRPTSFQFQEDPCCLPISN